MRAGARIAVGVALGLAVVFGAAPPALATAGPLTTSAKFDQTSYQPDAAVTVTVTVTNTGTDPVTNVTIDPHATGFDITSGTPAPVASLAGGDKATFTINGKVNQAGDNSGSVVINGTATFEGATGDAPSFNDSATVVTPTSTLSGKFFNFADNTGVAGGTIKLTNQADNSKTFSATSDSSGAYSVAGVPNGVYDVDVTAPSGWEKHGTPLAVVSMPHADAVDVPLDQVAVPVNTSTPGTGSGTTAAQTTTHAAATLANTGTPIRWIAGGGAAVVLAGAVLLLLARRRREETTEISETTSS
jgi:LPXTG-motif cell wall-anchored protein